LSLPGLCVVLLALTALAAGVLVQMQTNTERRAEEQAVESARLVSDLIAHDHVSSDSYLPGSQLMLWDSSGIHDELAPLRRDGRLTDFEIWRADGTPVWLDGEQPAEATLPAAELARMRQGVPWVQDSPAGERSTPSIEVFLPQLGSTGQAVGVVEVVLPQQPLSDQVQATTTTFTLAAVLLVLGVIAVLLVLRHRLRTREHEARHDGLTGLLNRKAFLHDASLALRAAGPTRPAGLLVIDLDGFKTVNDTLGHAAGDALLVQVAAALRASVRPTDAVARLGGDEFAVLIAELPAAALAERVAGNVLRSLRESAFEVDGVLLAVDASVGVTVAPQDGGTVEELLQRADVAMYQAKRGHRGTTRYDAAADHHDVGDLAVLVELRHAIEADELVLHYQPQIGLADSAVVGMEALVRWQHPERGLLGPGAFVPQAEGTGLMRPLTEWVLRTAVAQAADWSRAGSAVRVAVNISPRSLLEDDLPATVLSVLTGTGLPPQLLELEITETAVMTDPARAAEVLGRIDAMGVQVSIDDFGAGYTSLSHLKTLPVRALKIDRGLVTHMLERPHDEVITEALIELGHRLGLTIVAEGVETEEVRDRLAMLFCDEAQGFLLSRPVPAPAVEGWLTAWRAEHPTDRDPSPYRV
jgi:diguanylate cyclase (GGDEF)-like protein